MEEIFLVVHKDDNSKRMVALILGQSNVGNYGPVKGDAGPDVYVLNDGALQPAIDPLPGAPHGHQGSVWTRLAPKLISRGVFDEIILIARARGGSRVDYWAPGGDLHSYFQSTLSEVSAAGLVVSHVFWHQGEMDAGLGTSGSDYRRDFMAIVKTLRDAGISAPIFLCVASYARGVTSPEIQAAQREMVDPAAGIFAGPDTDVLGSDYRYDDVHLNERGQEEFSTMLFDCLIDHHAKADRDALAFRSPVAPVGQE